MAQSMITKMNLAAIDLNLLVAFEAMMQECHVTMAARRVGLAQPSMSNALARLRVLVGDRLFIRNGRRMQPTAKAIALALPISAALEQIRRTLDPNQEFDPRTAQTRFTIGASDYVTVIGLPNAISALRREAPGVALRLHAVTDKMDMRGQVEHGEIDALIGGRILTTPRLHRIHLFMERYVGIRDAARASSEPAIDKDAYVDLPQVWFDATRVGNLTWGAAVVSPRSGAAPGKTHSVALTLPHVAAIPFAVAGTDLLGIVPERIAQRLAAAAGVSIVSLPFEMEPFSIDLFVTRKRHSEAALRWLVDLIIRETKDL
jgi:DNA-binding transcriptional LysR family regulator